MTEAKGVSAPYDPEYRRLHGGAYVIAPVLIPAMTPNGIYTLLDVGGGSGTVGASTWRERGVKVQVIDAWEGYGFSPPDPITLRGPRIEFVPLHLRAEDALHYFGVNAFDMVLACDVIEHVEKEVGRKLLVDFAQIAKRVVHLTTPCGYTVQDPKLTPEEPWANNPFQKHVCGWLPEEFIEAGYSIYMNGRNERGGYAGAYVHAYKIF